ncbi:EAL domain-containing protein [Brockia lithotrophica]|uniref:Diguanylate cyclase (GGDEF)-like protein n=1 Tax=Brockia lithotrophica TaxID=933949 RepID=A0A660L3B0_9BACL|nr:EAL domain-containing protein [Brockia lithotrophica]RKQ88501.1 diguanylate cyclase (GGDEF)-like protein [Brockia lithotrophica]
MASREQDRESGPFADAENVDRGRDGEEAAPRVPGTVLVFTAADKSSKDWLVRPVLGCDFLTFAGEGRRPSECANSGCSLEVFFPSGAKAVRRALDAAYRRGYALTAVPEERGIGVLHLFPGDAGVLLGLFFPPDAPRLVAPCWRSLASVDTPIFVHAYGKIVFANGAAVQALARGGEAELLGKSPLKLFVPEDRPLFFRALMEPGRAFLLRTADSYGGEPFFLRTRPLDEDAAGFFVSSLVPVREEERTGDVLLDIPSRQEFLRTLDRLLRHNVPPFAVVLVDVDRFKVYNDAFGPEVGDELLRAARDLFRTLVSGNGLVARMAGDEYGLVFFLPSEDPKALDELLAKLTTVARGGYDPFVVEGRTYHLTFSVGVAVYPEDGQSVEELLRAAEGALVRAKERGRGKVVRYVPQGKDVLVRQLVLEMDLWGALERGELVLYYQPLYDVLRGKLVGMEALLRWRHPEMGLIPPAEFLPQAEDTGLIVPIGEWVLREALRQLVAWERETGEVLRAYVNVSAVQFDDPEFVRRVAAIVAESGVQPNRLELELTESVLMRDIEASVERLKELKAMGIRIAVDDFGTGYSSLSYLRRLPIDAVKIDRSFVWEVKDEKDTGTIATAVIYLAHALGLEVVAEGVETEWQKEFLASNSLQIMQGYYFGKPLPAEEFAATYLRKAT